MIKNRAPDVFSYESDDDDDDDDDDDTISETFCTEAVSSDDDQGEDSDSSSAASCSDEISKKGKHENSEESAGSEGDVEVTNSSKKEVNSNCESGSSTIDVEYGLPPELVTKFSCSVPFTLPPHKTALVAAILDGYVSFNGKGIISPSDLNSLQGGNMVEEDNYLTDFIVDKYFEITQAARADGSKVVLFPWEAFEKSAIKLLFTRAADTLLEQDIILAPCCPITTDHWFLIAVFPQNNLMVALDSLAGDFVKPSLKASMLKMWQVLEKVDINLDVSQWQFAVNKPNDLPQQSNSFDCGVFNSLYARCLVAEGVMLSDEQSISDFRKHMLLELHSQSLIPVSSATYRIEKGSYYAVDYVNNYYVGRALSAPDTSNFAEFKFLHRIRKTNVKRFEWPNHDDIDRVHSSCVFYGPLNSRGHGPFEIVDTEELEAVFKLVSK